MLLLLNRFSLTERALVISLVASAAMIAGAHMFERIGGLLPCILCLDQREAHWTALAISFVGLVIARLFKSKMGAAAAVGAAALVYAVSTGLAFYHTGVEYGYWPGPAICSGGAVDLDITNLAESLDKPASGPSCEDVQWRFLGISMAGYNLLASAGLFALTLFAALAETRAARRNHRSA
ncbi:disulfide bond formation protein B [Hyphococcus sp. DH-69]|uniref:disulfide bond formation protein B n=1 Tax=Hyphococcus formosus TaxID=3143534 RepID=UPI00398B5EA5